MPPAGRADPSLSEEKPGLFDKIFSSFIDGVVLVSGDHTILNSNPAIEEMFQRSRDSFEGRPLAELFHEPASLENKLARTFATGVSFRDIECAGIKRNSRNRFPVSLTLSPYHSDADHIEGVVVLVKDLSLIKELQATSRPVEHLATMGYLAMGMAHEIRNPLGGIRASAQLLKAELTSKDQQEYLDVVISEVDRINHIVEQMMGFTGPRQLDLAEINIHKLLDEILLLHKTPLREKRIQIERIYDPSLPPILGDEDKLKQVFLNLIKNAVEASGDDRKIALISRVGSGFTIKAAKDGCPRQSIVVEITDSGAGMNRDTLENLFTPFFSTKTRGSGLGLPISLKIVENHGGKIKVTSEEGLGTTVQVFLPIGNQ